MKAIPAIAMGAALLSVTLAPDLRAQGTFELPATWKYDSRLADDEAIGFYGRMHQARKNSNLTATIARGNAQLAGLLIDPNTSQPYENVAVVRGDPIIGAGWTGTNPILSNGVFVILDVVNFHTDADGLVIENGNFNTGTGHTEGFFPGLPGAESEAKITFNNGQNFAIEVITWLDLPAGPTILGVHHNDAVELAFHPNDARDIFRQQALGFDSNAGEADRTITVNVAEAGLYSVRLLLSHWNGPSMLEFYSAFADAPGVLTPVNDRNSASSLFAWGELTEVSRPYVAAVAPVKGASGVAPNTAITVAMGNAEFATPVMRVNGEDVKYTKTTTLGVTALSHMPPTPFGTGETVNVELDYGAASATWSFNTLSGRKALLITGGGQLNSGDGWISQRLSTRFGFDVSVVADTAVVLADAADADLVYNSSTVLSGQVADVRLETLAVPLINAEGANVDDFKLVDLGGGFGNNPGGGITQLVIDDNTHPITQGLALGNMTVFTSNIQTHWGTSPVNGAQLASTPGQLGRGLLFVIEEGDPVEDGGVPFVHPARRIHFGMGNDGAGAFTPAGVELFDRVVEWALAKPEPEVQPFITAATRDEATGDYSITWRSIPDRFYIIEVSQTLEGGWGDLNDSFQATGDFSTFIDTEAADFSERFYRIGLLPVQQ